MISFTRMERLQNLRHGYRSAFQAWVSAERMVRDRGPQTGAAGPAQERADAAALAYAEARNHLMQEMLTGAK